MLTRERKLTNKQKIHKKKTTWNESSGNSRHTTKNTRASIKHCAIQNYVCHGTAYYKYLLVSHIEATAVARTRATALSLRNFVFVCFVSFALLAPENHTKYSRR